jgi:hypothetical protein
MLDSQFYFIGDSGSHRTRQSRTYASFSRFTMAGHAMFIIKRHTFCKGLCSHRNRVHIRIFQMFILFVLVVLFP